MQNLILSLSLIFLITLINLINLSNNSSLEINPSNNIIPEKTYQTSSPINPNEEIKNPNNNNNNEKNEKITSTPRTQNYNFFNFVQKVKYLLQPIPQNSLYKSNNTCVTFPDQIKFNYTVDFYTYEYRGKIFPQNFCYGLLTYNISRNDFSDIVNKNVRAFQNFQKLNLMRQLYDFSPSKSFLSECSGYLRNIACWSEFPACIDNGDKTWTASPVCESYCTAYKINCKKVKGFFFFLFFFV